MNALVTLMVLGATTVAHAQVRHVPPADAEAGKQLELVAMASPTTATLVVHVRAKGTTPFTAIPLVRKDDASWVAVVPAETIAPPGIDYYIAAGTSAVFATPEWPHALNVNVPADDERRARDMIRVRGRRSRLRALGEWVEFGTTTSPNGSRLADNYYRFDADVSYRLWSYPLEEIRVGYTRLLGTTRIEDTSTCMSAAMCTAEAGFKVAVWFELGLAPIEGVTIDGRLTALATQTGFALGGRGEVRLGDREASHVAVGGEILADVGANGFFRLGWGTVPKLPMSATVEVTNLPADYRDVGVRFYYDIAREVIAGLRLGFRVGYAARTQSVAGFTGGIGAAVEF